VVEYAHRESKKDGNFTASHRSASGKRGATAYNLLSMVRREWFFGSHKYLHILYQKIIKWQFQQSDPLFLLVIKHDIGTSTIQFDETPTWFDAICELPSRV